MKSGLRILIWAPQVPFSVPPKTPKMGHFGYFGGTKNGTSGARIKILRPLFNTNNPHLDTLGTILDPGKVMFGHFFYFGHFPIEIPIEAEKIYQHGKELSYRENKICSETSEAMRTTWEHAQSDLKNFSQ